MKPELQRIAIAKACGWTIETTKDPQSWLFGGWPPNTPTYGLSIHTTYYRELPFYLSDLNAMHEAEKVIPKGSHQEQMYLVSLGWNIDMTPADARRLSHATAAERAEAFLHTLNLWSS